MDMKNKLKELEEKIGYTFHDKDLLEQAMRHSSYANEHHMGRLRSNERLEFLGDAVLELTTSEYLYEKFPEMPEGDATKTRASIVCEAFAGNIILKLYEGVGATLISMVKKGMMASLRSKIGALLVKPALKQTLKRFDTSQYGGAPMLGLKGLVVKTHGSSKAVEVRNSIIQCVTFTEQRMNDKIKAGIQAEEN